MSGDFVGSANRDGKTITATIAGTADYAALDAVEQLLNEVHDTAAANGVTEAVVDMTKLEFMNSSCFKCFVSWISVLQELPPAKQYKVKFISNPQLHWQKRSLHSLRCFAVELITVSES